MSSREFKLDFSDMSGGLNSAFPPHALAENQVSETLNLVHEPIGISRAPGYLGIEPSGDDGEDYLHTGFMTYVLDNGTKHLIVINNQGQIFTFAPSTGVYTEIGSCTASNNEWSYVNSVGKLWICNGVDFLVIDSSLDIRAVQLPTPDTGGTLNHDTAGNLDAGTYLVYYSYAVVDGDGYYLYSLPYYVGSVTVGANGRIQIPFEYGDSTIDKVVFFLTDAGGEYPYYYYEITNVSGGGSSTQWVDATYADESISMAIVSAGNQLLPITPNSIFAFDNKIFVWIEGSKNIYWSITSDTNPFDLERFPAENFRVMTYSIYSMFSINMDLFFNHVGIGISVAYYGDMGSAIKLIQRMWYFLKCKTGEGKTFVCFTNNIAIGLTNDGFRLFDGTAFSNDLSFHIKPEIDRFYAHQTRIPSAVINRRSGKRTEYRFSYEKIDYGTSGNNDQLVFNLDFYFDPVSPKKTWENWENGFDFQEVIDGVWYGDQSSTSGSYIVKEHGAADNLCYNRLRAYCSTDYVKRVYMLSRTAMNDLDTISVWGAVYGLATSSGEITGNIIIFDDNNTKYPFTVVGASAALAILPSAASGLGLALPFVMGAITPRNTVVTMPFDCRGNCVAIEITQTENDSTFFVYKIQLPRIHREKNNLT